MVGAKNSSSYISESLISIQGVESGAKAEYPKFTLYYASTTQVTNEVLKQKPMALNEAYTHTIGL